jgi:hypothetical protein
MTFPSTYFTAFIQRQFSCTTCNSNTFVRKTNKNQTALFSYHDNPLPPLLLLKKNLTVNLHALKMFPHAYTQPRRSPAAKHASQEIK